MKKLGKKNWDDKREWICVSRVAPAQEAEKLSDKAKEKKQDEPSPRKGYNEKSESGKKEVFLT